VNIESALAKLTERQKQCLRMLASGKRSKTIGATLGLSSWTVEQLMEKARLRLGVATRSQAAKILLAFERGAPRIIKLGNGRSSLEFRSQEAERVMRALHRLGGLRHIEGADAQLIDVKGQTFVRLGEWEDHCIISTSAEGDELLQVALTNLAIDEVALA